jgi:hypothetical protein
MAEINHDGGGTSEIIDDLPLALPIHQNLRAMGGWLRAHSEFAPEDIIERGSDRLRIVAVAAGSAALGIAVIASGAMIYTRRHAH